MVTTRSGSKSTTSASKPASNVSRKRIATKPPSTSSPSKKLKQAKLETTEDKQTIKNPIKSESNSSAEPIIINRAPVLHLWGATVTHHAYPKLPWSTCLSAGAAVSAICAVSKGKSIGTIESQDSGAKKKKAADVIDFDEEIEVMQFHLNLKGSKAYMGTTAESTSDDGLRKKFGEKYDEAKECFEKALEGKSVEDIRKRGFHMYESFRPNVKPGTNGWGRKGELDLDRVKKVVDEG